MVFLQMTAEEICINYRQAANKSKQVGILAELNQVTKAEIAEILNRGGCDIVLKKRSPRVKWTDDKIKRLRELRESGMSVKEIAVALGAGRQAVATKLSLEGIVSGERRR